MLSHCCRLKVSPVSPGETSEPLDCASGVVASGSVVECSSAVDISSEGDSFRWLRFIRLLFLCWWRDWSGARQKQILMIWFHSLLLAAMKHQLQG
ncbi:hypothetical protein KCU91_g153, partial [Aureobasidium melanogenum]